MTTVTIRDVPDTAVTVLKTRASASGRSLQSYLLDILTKEATTSTLEEMVSRLDRETHTDVANADVLAALDEARERR